jgi:hypothetical protein
LEDNGSEKGKEWEEGCSGGAPGWAVEDSQGGWAIQSFYLSKKLATMRRELL